MKNVPFATVDARYEVSSLWSFYRVLCANVVDARAFQFIWRRLGLVTMKVGSRDSVNCLNLSNCAAGT